MRIVNTGDELAELNYTWDFVSFINKKLILQINFTDPLEIGNSEVGDEILMIDILDKNLFKISDYMEYESVLDPESYTLTKRLTKQLNDDLITKSFASALTFFEYEFDESFSLGYIMSFLLTLLLVYLFGSIEYLHIIAFMTMLNLRYSSNAQFLSKIII